MKLGFLILSAAVLAISCPPAQAQDESSNLAPNASFEEPDGGIGQTPTGWFPFTSKMNTSTLSDMAARTGKQSLRMSAQKIPDAYQGMNLAIPVTEGEKYDFSAFVIGDKEDKAGGTAHGMLVIEWKREDGSEISRSLSKQWKAQGISRLRWEPISLDKAIAPKGAVKAVFGIHFCDGPQGGKGAIFVDDMMIEKR